MSPYSTSRTFVTAPIVIQPRQLVSPPTFVPQILRPTFTVRNAGTAGRPGRLVYRFEIATDVAFSAVVVSATVPEGAGQTSFRPSSDLAAGVTYFWRVEAIDTLTGISSGFFDIRRFVTEPAGGRAFDLTITPPSSCANQPIGGQTGNNLAHGSLIQSGNSWHFFLPDALSGDLVIDVISDGARLSGTVRGGSGGGIAVFPAKGVAGPVPTTGSIGADGRLGGTFDGYVEFHDELGGASCAGSGFTWTLSPSASSSFAAIRSK